MSSTKRIDSQNFKPFRNFLKLLPVDLHGMPINDRIKCINEQLAQYRVVWDITDNSLQGINGSNELIFENEEAFTWFILRWS